MNATFSLEQIPKTGPLDFSLIFLQYKPDLLVKFMEIKPLNPRTKQDQLEKELVCSSSILKQCRNDMKMVSAISHKRRQEISNTSLDDDSLRERDVKRPKTTSNDLKIYLVKPESAVNHKTKNQSKLKGGSVWEIGETNNEYLD